MTSLTILTRYWREAAIGVLVATLAIVIAVASLRLEKCHRARDDAVAALARTKADYGAAQAKATADNLAAVRGVEQRQAAITNEVQDDLTKKLDAARALGAAHAERLRVQSRAARGAAGTAGVSRTADAARGVADANRDALVADDIRICTDNTVKVAGWRDWWTKSKGE